MAQPLPVRTSSRTRSFGYSSPSMTISARASALAATLTQSTSSTGRPRSPPAMVSSSNPSGVVGASNDVAT